jgi:hypothetical protein
MAMKRIIEHMRNNMNSTDWQTYCEDVITAAVLIVVVGAMYGWFGF